MGKNKSYSSSSTMLDPQQPAYPVLTPAEVLQHSLVEDLWMIVFGKVYNATPFLLIHPGGAEVLLDCAGVDATEAFVDVGHSQDAVEMLSPYQVGVVEGEESTQYEDMKSENRIETGEKALACPNEHFFKRNHIPKKKKNTTRDSVILYSGIALTALSLIILLQRQQWLKIST